MCLTSVLCSTLLVFLLLLLVCLVGYYWDLEVAHERLVITGEATLSGALGSVGGLRGKLLAAYHHLIVAKSDSSFVAGSACVIVPSDNTSGASGVLVENRSAVNARAMVKVRGARSVGMEQKHDSAKAAHGSMALMLLASGDVVLEADRRAQWCQGAAIGLRGAHTV